MSLYQHNPGVSSIGELTFLGHSAVREVLNNLCAAVAASQDTTQLTLQLLNFAELWSKQYAPTPSIEPNQGSSIQSPVPPLPYSMPTASYPTTARSVLDSSTDGIEPVNSGFDAADSPLPAARTSCAACRNRGARCVPGACAFCRRIKRACSLVETAVEQGGEFTPGPSQASSKSTPSPASVLLDAEYNGIEITNLACVLLTGT